MQLRRKASGFPEFQLLAAVWLWKREGLERPTKEGGKDVITLRTAQESRRVSTLSVHCDCHPGLSLQLQFLALPWLPWPESVYLVISA